MFNLQSLLYSRNLGVFFILWYNIYGYSDNSDLPIISKSELSVISKFMWILVVQRMLLELVWDLVYFPVWWYTGGVKHAGVFCFGLLQDANYFLAPSLWLKNMFVPMFGQTDLQGRLMSIFMRFVNFIGRSIAFFVWFIIVLGFFGLWFIFPILVFYMLLFSLGNS